MTETRIETGTCSICSIEAPVGGGMRVITADPVVILDGDDTRGPACTDCAREWDSAVNRHAAELGALHQRLAVRRLPGRGSIDLEAAGSIVHFAATHLAAARAALRADVVLALEAGDSESAVARQAGVDRMTVREWAGKPRR